MAASRAAPRRFRRGRTRVETLGQTLRCPARMGVSGLLHEAGYEVLPLKGTRTR
jgi:hypothetical protein